MKAMKEHALKAIEGAGKRYEQDLLALSDESFSKSAGGSARTPADFTFEILRINDRIAKRLRQEDPGPFPFDGWIKAPEDFGTKEEVASKFSDSVSAIKAALEKTPDEEMQRVIKVQDGETNPFDIVTFCAMHINYHDAQLNYIQALNGDMAMHWD